MRTPKKHVAKDGNVTWRVRYRNSERKQSTETFPDYGGAREFCELLENMPTPEAALRYIDDRVRTREVESVKLDDVAAQFFDWKATRVRSDRTVADYRRDYDNWVRPRLGDKPAALVAESDVQAWVDWMQPQLSPKSVADRHAILHGIYGWASAPSRRTVDHNPCVGTELPKRRKSRPKGLRPAEWQALYAALEQIDADGADLCHFLISTGWRWSEATALSAYDVEDNGQAVHVNVDRVIRRNAAGEFVVVEDTKSDAGARRIKLDASAAQMVRLRMDKIHGGDRPVFTTAGGVQWHYSNFRRDVWDPAVSAANLSRKPTPHWLRHTHVGWLLVGGGANLAEVQRRIGHENISTTVDVYGRMVADVGDGALEQFATMRDELGTGDPPDAPAIEG